ncbi:MAG: helix-turn-helix domain-containing protein [Planctomycetota bacterium]
MSDEDTQRSIAKRQIARLIGGGAYPAYVLSEEFQIVFANEALGKLVCRDPDSLIGLSCPRSIDSTQSSRGSGITPDSLPESTETQRQNHPLAAWLSPFPNSDPRLASLHRDSLPTFLTPIFEPNDFWLDPIGQREENVDNSRSWIRISIPLELGESPVTLVFLKPNQGDIDAIPDGENASRIKAIAMSQWLEFPTIADLWFLHGASPSSAATRHQLTVAASGTHSLLIEGFDGAPSLLLAHAIHRARSASQHAVFSTTSRPFTIDCRLMDRDLLQSTFDWIDDEARHGNVPTVVVHGIELLPAELRQPLARKQQQGQWCVFGTTGNAEEIRLGGNPSAWTELLALMQTQTLRLSPLAERLGDMESLVSAWMDQWATRFVDRKHSTWSRGFLDAIQAYRWPRDCEEFHQAMEQAVRASEGGVLQESHLPISIRTFPSHLAHESPMDPIDLDVVLENIERELITRAVQRFPRNRTAAAKLIGISRARLLRRLQQWEIGGSESGRASEEDAVVFEELEEGNDSP